MPREELVWRTTPHGHQRIAGGVPPHWLAYIAAPDTDATARRRR